MSEERYLTFALGKGRLANKTMELLEKVGITCEEIKNQLNAELRTVDTADFIERTARREYGYCWYGETIYEVGNLEDILPEQDFEVYGQQ